MRSIIHGNFGEPVDVLEQADMPKPEPKAGEVRIKTIMSPIHNHDVWTVRGSYGYKPILPAIGGSEAVGVVDALGEGVSHVQIGAAYRSCICSWQLGGILYCTSSR
ncbi:NADPH:quinone reductase, partial [Acinetobacter seifertii]